MLFIEKLFKHQTEVIKKTYEILKKKICNVLIVLPTGAGKTIVKAQFAKDFYNQGKVTLIFAHRDVLLVQISLALCSMRVPHNFMVSRKTRTYITNLQVEKYGQSFWDESSTIYVVSVNAFLARLKKGILDKFCKLVDRWMMDEAHHTLRKNMWGRVLAPLTNAFGIGVTATPCRSDKKGLGSDADGVFDEMIVGATMAELIVAGRLAPYKIFVPPTKVDFSGLRVNRSGDYNVDELAEVTDNADITGDAVEHYQKLAAGKKAICFTCNIQHSDHVAAQFNRSGIPARSISSNNSDDERTEALEDFKAGRILILVNCDLFGEGFDVPSVEVCIMLRKTESYSLFKQQFGRCLRVLAGKEFGILIDHVGNVQRHCLDIAPHDDPEWTLDGEPSRRSIQDIREPVGLVCSNDVCKLFYVPVGGNKTCPNCGHTETPAEVLEADKLWQAEKGDLVELTVDFIDQIMAERNHVDKPVEQIREEMHYATNVVRNSVASNHAKRQFAQNELRFEIQEWCVATGIQELWDIETTQREFELRFGINILKAQTLSERKALELLEKIRNDV